MIGANGTSTGIIILKVATLINRIMNRLIHRLIQLVSPIKNFVTLYGYR